MRSDSITCLFKDEKSYFLWIKFEIKEIVKFYTSGFECCNKFMN